MRPIALVGSHPDKVSCKKTAVLYFAFACFSAPRAPGEHVIKKHRYSGFFGTDLDIILREWGVDTVIISGTTTENCCHATARDAMLRNYRVVFLSDATATYDYPDRGFGAMSNADVHHAMLVILADSTAHVMSVTDMNARIRT